MERTIKKVVRRKRADEPEPIHALTPQEAVAEVEELRRLFIQWLGDPDQPMVRAVTRRRLNPPCS